ncbi:NAD(P)H-dependent oxidoreductase [Brevibacterium sp. ZH18]|uniref:NAD(P)H-dependent oxidoreductase n=1 Tax=Brevibacterium sp. ZH18 TaxID=2927784 RepID=UPI001F606031|nr:NAD(P)H-dependent oxidoreductase [Brevibacterium sp. ZH18]MCI4010831.1 NAD(P)H-dependent oxidoreductase [Brevibacterium sp. ZH18]
MHLLTVFAHPIRTSYPGAVMDAFHEPFAAAGHSIDVLDLHAEGFDPRFTAADHQHFWGGPIPTGIADMHERVEVADRLAFVFPVYWWSMPALMKGWIERVFTGDWAYQYGSGVADRGKEPLNGLLPRVPTTLIGVGGSKQRTYDKYGYGDAMHAQLDIGVFAYCGITDVESHLIYDVEGEHNAGNRVAGLDQAREIATVFVSPNRTPVNAKDEYLRRRRTSEVATAEFSQ